MSVNNTIEPFCNYYSDGLTSKTGVLKRESRFSDWAAFWVVHPVQVNLYKMMWKEFEKTRSIPIKLQKGSSKFVPFELIATRSIRPSNKNSACRIVAKTSLEKSQMNRLASRCDFLDVQIREGKHYPVFGKFYLDKANGTAIVSFDTEILDANHMVIEFAMAEHLFKLGLDGRKILISGNICRQMRFPRHLFGTWPEVLNWVGIPNLSDEEDDAVQSTPRLLQSLADTLRPPGDVLDDIEGEASLLSKVNNIDISALKNWLPERLTSRPIFRALELNRPGKSGWQLVSSNTPELPDERWLVGLKDSQKRNRLFRYWYEKGIKPAKIRDEYNRLPEKIRRKFGNGQLIDIDINDYGIGLIKDGLKADRKLFPLGFEGSPRDR
jgi:hypothetical protein